MTIHNVQLYLMNNRANVKLAIDLVTSRFTDVIKKHCREI